MFEFSLSSVRERLEKTFPERQIIHRTSGQINSFVIGQKAQIAAVSGAALIAGWCMFTMINLAYGHSPLRSPAKEVKRVESQYQRLLIDARANEANARALLASQQREFTEAAKSFEQKHNTIKEIMGSTGVVKTSAPITSTEYASSNVLMSPVTRDSHERQARNVSILTPNTATSNIHAVSFSSLSLDQNDILIEAETLAQDNIETNRAIIRETGLTVEALLKEGPFGTGGPFISLETDEIRSANEANFGSRVASIRARVAEADALDQAMQSMPFGNPIDAEFYKTSGYGPRKDPFTKRTAFHGGIDFAGQHMSPITATAAGQVSFSGTKSGYGTVVEIDHEHGIKTRYAHLAKSYVKRGEIIVKGEKIGGMGSSGRSTSTHLHYEVIFQGRSKDPEKFMKAGRYVQQN